MNYVEVFASLNRVKHALEDLQYATEMAAAQNTAVEDAILTHTHLDPNLLGAVLNLSALLKP